jgi:hypothetical protein
VHTAALFTMVGEAGVEAESIGAAEGSATRGGGLYPEDMEAVGSKDTLRRLNLQCSYQRKTDTRLMLGVQLN